MCAEPRRRVFHRSPRATARKPDQRRFATRRGSLTNCPVSTGLSDYARFKKPTGRSPRRRLAVGSAPRTILNRRSAQPNQTASTFDAPDFLSTLNDRPSTLFRCVVGFPSRRRVKSSPPSGDFLQQPLSTACLPGTSALFAFHSRLTTPHSPLPPFRRRILRTGASHLPGGGP